MTMTLCLYWTSKNYNKDGIRITRALYIEPERKLYKLTSGPAIPHGVNAIEVKTSYDIDKAADTVKYADYTEMK